MKKRNQARSEGKAPPPLEPPELDWTGLEVLRVWRFVQGHTRPGTPEPTKTMVNGEAIDDQLTPYHLDFGEMQHAIAMLRPEVETEELMQCLSLMQSTKWGRKPAYTLDPALLAHGKERPHWVWEERARIGILNAC